MNCNLIRSPKCINYSEDNFNFIKISSDSISDNVFILKPMENPFLN